MNFLARTIHSVNILTGFKKLLVWGVAKGRRCESVLEGKRLRGAGGKRERGVIAAEIPAEHRWALNANAFMKFLPTLRAARGGKVLNGVMMGPQVLSYMPRGAATLRGSLPSGKEKLSSSGEGISFGAIGSPGRDEGNSRNECPSKFEG